MKRRRLTRFQILLLVLVAGLVVARMVTGPPPPKGLIVFTEIEPYELRHAAFELQQPALFAVRATGSYEDVPRGNARPSLAAYGWVLRRDTREPVWQMDPSMGEAGVGTTVQMADSIDLEAGVYDVYFATYGDTYATRRSRRSSRWPNDAEQWRFVLDVVDEAVPVDVIPSGQLEDIAQSMPGLVWTSAPMRSDRQDTYLFDVAESVDLEVYAVGEIERQPSDYAWIEDIATGERIWEMTEGNTTAAGGLERNRRVRTTLTLAPGVYRAVGKTNNGHAMRDWNGNPPYDPAGWGLSLSASNPSAITPFEPWSSRQPLFSFTEVRNGEAHHQRFEVLQPAHVIAYGMGEITGAEGIYDYAELLKEEGERPRRIWRMSAEASVHAGGGDKNRYEAAFLTLEPGIYIFSYVTDRSHAFGDWNVERPDHPDRWGGALFPIADADAEAVRLLEAAPEDRAVLNEAPVVIRHGETLASWTEMGEEVHQQMHFILEEPTKLHIISLGEITISGQHDYGWIDRVDTGEVVWEMTLDNTQHAGGVDRNRRFDGVVELGPGTYTLHYRTDFSHHYNDFNGGGPHDPEAWGLVAYYVVE